MKIKDLPLSSRPRENAIKYGIESLSDTDLLAIILTTGYKEINVIQLATNIINEYGDLSTLFKLDYYSLLKINGIKKAKALTLLSIGEIIKRVSSIYTIEEYISIDDIINKYQRMLLNKKQEEVILISLDRNNKVIHESLLYRGTFDSVKISTRDIFLDIYRNNAYAFYLIHTHPNMISYPSDSDIKLTKRMMSKTKNVGIRFIDHLIIGQDGVVSVMNLLNNKLI